MKEELKNKLPYCTLIISIIALAITIIVFIVPVATFGIVLGIIGVALSIVCLRKDYKKVGRVSLICSIASILIELVFIWMYLSAN